MTAGRYDQHGQLPDASEQGDTVLAFVPESALRPDLQKTHGLLGATSDTTFVIDCDMFATLPRTDGSAVARPAEDGRPQSPATGGDRDKGHVEQDLQQLRTDLNRKKEEIDALKGRWNRSEES